ncbi:MAG TPA: hypothetical protein DFR83_18895 [Deltaproteobacteria bacterium]|nr:hypothetical protein [Deltaproteobacteria bacterium]
MTTLPELVQQGLAAHQAGDPQAARRAYTAVLRLQPQHVVVLHLSGLLAHQCGQHEDARARVEQALRLRPRAAQIHTTHGRILEALGQLDAARTAHETAVRLQPDLLEARFQWARLLSRTGDTVSARAQLDPLIARAPDHLELRQERAAIAREQGDHAVADADLAQWARLRPLDLTPVVTAGMLAYERGEDRQAMEWLRQARERRLKQPGRRDITVSTKLQHDLQQLRWLQDRGELDGRDAELAIEAYTLVYTQLYGAPDAPAIAPRGLQPLSEHQKKALQPWYLQPHHVPECPAEPDGALNPALSRDAILAEWTTQAPGLAVLDGLLKPSVRHRLWTWCHSATIWSDFTYTGGYVGATIADGFVNPLLLQIARELRALLPELFANAPLRQAWAYKYAPRLQGINPHADAAAVNVNFWLAPDEANLDPTSGGLVVYLREAPLDWDFEAFNNDPARLMKLIHDEKIPPIRVPHRCNRAVVFNADLIHATDTLHFRPRYEDRRINVTMLFGSRS